MPVTLAGAFLVQAMIHGSLRVYGAENKVFSILMWENYMWCTFVWPYFLPNCLTVHIQFELDNVTAVSYVNQMGGSKSIACDLLAHKIWSWCIARSIWLSAVHIPGCTNVEADLLSRNCYSDHEWQLSLMIFQKLRAVFPALSIDFFASVLNAQLPRYVSWNPDPHATFLMHLVYHGRVNISMLSLLSA